MKSKLIATELINYTRILVLPGVEQEEAKRMRIGARCIVLDLLMVVSFTLLFTTVLRTLE